MPLPTRRAIRPDSRHHRQARRQGLSRSARANRTKALWLGLAILCLAALLVCGVIGIFSHEPHSWMRPVLYASLVGLIVSVATMLLAMRG